MKKLTEATAEFPEWQDFDDATPADGRSTAAVSNAGTPMSGNTNGGTKLKLTFNGNRDGLANGDEGMSDEE